MRCSTCGLVRTDPWPDDLGRDHPASYYSFAAPEVPTKRVVARAGRLTRNGSSTDSDAPSARRAASSRHAARQGRDGARRRLWVGRGAPRPTDDRLAMRDGVEIDGAAVAAAHEARPSTTCTRASWRRSTSRAAASSSSGSGTPSSTPVSPRAQLQIARGLLRPGGQLLIGVPSFGPQPRTPPALPVVLPRRPASPLALRAGHAEGCRRGGRLSGRVGAAPLRQRAAPALGRVGLAAARRVLGSRLAGKPRSRRGDARRRRARRRDTRARRDSERQLSGPRV